ncbi:unnamed protein product [Lactuca saligna]|uniref:Uncharacterized protein n=1 Tax=Lactuca saligna TaxID=75948 RepID=A0AA35YG46_LACSI|nr:unnamed protein product [Lactuca saligna]
MSEKMEPCHSNLYLGQTQELRKGWSFMLEVVSDCIPAIAEEARCMDLSIRSYRQVPTFSPPVLLLHVDDFKCFESSYLLIFFRKLIIPLGGRREGYNLDTVRGYVLLELYNTISYLISLQKLIWVNVHRLMFVARDSQHLLGEVRFCT